jgi:type IV pilus assembly protein PilF
MRQLIVIISFVLFLSACVSTETTVTKKNSGAGSKMEFDPQAAAQTRVKLALVHLKKNNMQQAKENIEKALEYQPDDADIYRVFAYYYQRVNETVKAEELYKKSLSLDRDNPVTHSLYGTFLCKQKRYQEADRAFLKALQQSNYSAVANTYENAGKCSEEAGNIEKAIPYYEYALSHDPRKSNLYLRLAKLFIDKKEYKAARLNLFTFQKNNETSAECLWQWIRLSYATDKNASLTKYAGKLLAEFPDSQQALDYLNHDYE